MLAALLAAGVAAMALQTAAAAAETPKADHQPYMHGYNVDQIKSWSPETDRFAKYFRSRVPLAERIPAFAPTQANPALSTEPQVMNLSADYDKEAFFEAYRYNDSFSRNLLNFWQYTDLYGSWHGLPVDGSSVTNPEFGVINLPNPAYRMPRTETACSVWADGSGPERGKPSPTGSRKSRTDRSR